MPPDVVVGEKHPILATALDRVLDDRLCEVGAVAVPYELDAMAVLARLGGRAGVRIEIDAAVLLGDLRDGIRDTGVQPADEKGRFVARDHPLRHTRSGRRRGLRVHVQRFDPAAQHATLVVELLDGHHRAQSLFAPRCGVLSGRVHGQADDEWLLLRRLRPDAIGLPRTEERGATHADGNRRQ